jgi:hypothetical protein
MTSRLISKGAWAVVVALLASGCAWGQYGGGGGTGTGGTGTGTYSNRSYGNGAKIGAAVGGGAGAGLLIYALHRHHTHAQLVGCVATDGKSLTADKDKKTYQLSGEPVTPGERVAIAGKKNKGGNGNNEFEVISVTKSLGQCQQSTAMATTP